MIKNKLQYYIWLKIKNSNILLHNDDDDDDIRMIRKIII
jgi:hypothetical protein